MDLDAYSLRLRKWTKEEKESVLKLRLENGWGPLRISKETGIPIGQIKFWVYGIQGRKKKQKVKRSTDAEVSKRRYYRTKFNDWFSYKSQTLRSGLIKRHGSKEGVPSSKEIREFLVSCQKNCAFCQVSLDDKSFSVDHKIPISRGGGCGLDNLVQCCRRCNTAKGSMNVNEYMQIRNLVSSWEDGGKNLFGRLMRGGRFA